MVEKGALLEIHRETVQADWVDYNDHMNVAYYVLIFDHATDAVLDHVGLDAAYREATGGSVFVVEAHVTYEGEVHGGDEVRVTSQIIDADDKRLHLFHRMYGPGSDKVAATNELMIFHVDLETRRSVPFPDAQRDKLLALANSHSILGRPDQAGSIIGIRRKAEP